MLNDMGPRRKALVDALSGPNPMAGGMPGAAGIAPGEMTPNAGPAPTLDQPIPAAAAAPSAPTPAKAFQSGNASVSGYLQDAMKSFAPTIHGIKDEAGRKSALKDYLTSIAPEVQARGGSMSNIGNSDKARVDGRTIDFFRDIEGAADPQYLDVTDEIPAAAQMGGSADLGALTGAQNNLDGLLKGDPQQQIQDALAALTGQGNKPNLTGLIRSLSGGR